MAAYTTRLTIGRQDSVATLEAEDDARGVFLAQDLLYRTTVARRENASVAVARGAEPAGLTWLGVFDFDSADGRVHWCPAEGSEPIPPFSGLVDLESFPTSGPDALRRRRKLRD